LLLVINLAVAGEEVDMTQVPGHGAGSDGGAGLWWWCLCGGKGSSGQSNVMNLRQQFPKRIVQTDLNSNETSVNRSNNMLYRPSPGRITCTNNSL
jgi:hypothetical protein